MLDTCRTRLDLCPQGGPGLIMSGHELDTAKSGQVKKNLIRFYISISLPLLLFLISLLFSVGGGNNDDDNEEEEEGKVGFNFRISKNLVFFRLTLILIFFKI